MKASELIDELKRLILQHGDLEIVHETLAAYCPIDRGSIYMEDPVKDYGQYSHDDPIFIII